MSQSFCEIAFTGGVHVQTAALSSVFKFCSYSARFIAAISGAAFGVFSIAILLFALTANARPVSPGSAPLPGDDFTKFLENLTYTTDIRSMEIQGLTKGGAGFEPWSGSYWPIHKAVLGNRYASKTFAHSKSFVNNYESYQANPSSSFISAGRISELSPAEKYDLLVGDSNWTLTKHMWEKALLDYQEDGIIAGWTGICHGWAAVTHMNPTSPHSPVTLQDVTGTHSITFHANDIKGLQSWLWASSSPGSFRAGDRCRGNVERDPYLRPTGAPCLDSNPMSWHLTIVNRVGLNKKSLVMDSSNGPEVWNYPIAGYDYHYFDPKTFIPTYDFKNALRSISELPSDVNRDFRSPKAKYIVGVVMDTFHPALTNPSTGITSKITTKKMTFVYDLELDEAFNVVGGEWYAKDNPDFIWSYTDNSQASTREDGKLRASQISWDARSGVMNPQVADLAREASKRGKVLATISNALLAASAKTVETPPPPSDGDGVAPEEEIDTGDGTEPNIPIEETPQPTP